MEIQIAKHSERISKLEEWQAKQNGSLQRLEQKVDGIYTWLIGLMGGVIASLIMLIVDFAVTRK
ncbi:hypothetical protein [Thermoanaerobacterium sp. PSU-2]|uniref:hypothetical protein n=1 Tax=Thermoanaerobacterium sp. PSU-2 TaxID=1930849 RepID=UPI0014388DE9|nr:hypothetical protein [Thermoanaerobacterium sp. PSU-2]